MEKPNYKEAQRKSKETKNKAYKPLPGDIWNPLVKFPRNNPCPCGSGKKFKVCHLTSVSPVIDEKAIKKIGA